MGIPIQMLYFGSLCFIEHYPEYNVDVKLCAFSSSEMKEAQSVWEMDEDVMFE